MQPAKVTLGIVQGATLRETIRIMQSQFEYRAIDGIAATAPAVLALDHGLPMDWPVWVKGVQGLQEVNRGTNQVPWLATVVDADSLEINAVTADGRKPVGGMLIYHPPVDLADASAVLLVLDEKGGELLALTATVHAGGWVDIEMSPEQTEALSWRKGFWQLDITFANGDVLRPFAGDVFVSPTGTPGAVGFNAPAWVYTFGAQGPAGSGTDLTEIYARLDALQQQIDELTGGGGQPSAVYSAGKWVVSDGKFVVSSGVH